MSARYPFVEALSALLALGVVERKLLGAPPGTFLDVALLEAVLDFAFLGGLLVASFVDLDWMEIPDEVSLPGAALGLLTASLRTLGPGPSGAALGAGLGFLIVQVPFVWLYERWRGRRGMGEGDAKLLLFVGAFTGWQGVLFALFAGSFQGLLYTAGALLLGRDPGARHRPNDGFEGGRSETGAEEAEGSDSARRGRPAVGRLRVPFGPFLALGAAEFYFAGQQMLEAYLGLFDGV